MYKIFFLLLTILVISKFQAQNHRFFYGLEFKKDSTSTEKSRDFYILDITKEGCKFYNYEFYKNDSIQRVKKSDFMFSYPNFRNSLNT